MSGGYRYIEINQALADDCDGFALHLFGNPSTRTRKAWRWKGALELTRTGKHRGLFRDWREARTYSPIAAAALVMGMSYEDAARWAALEYLRWPDRSKQEETATDRQRREEEAAAAQAARQKRQAEYDASEAREQAEKIDKVRGLWSRAVPVAGTPAEIYLRGRGINAENWPETLRWHAAKQCLLALSTSPEGDATALQAIHLTHTGKPEKRDDGSKIKLTHGVLRGGAVRFAGKADGPVVICEGPETALAVWYATGFEAWAGLGSIAGVSVETIPHARVIVACPDDDARGAPTIQAARKAIKRWQGEGRTVLIASPYDTLRHDKSDHLDALAQHGRDYVAARFAQVLETAQAKADSGTPLEQAREDLGHAVSQAMEQLIGEAIARQIEGEGDDDAADLPDTSAIASQIGIRVSVGGGKTKEAIEAMVSGVARMRRELGAHTPSVVYSVPTHRLGGELLHRIEAEAAKQGVNVSVRIWRGREAIEPESGEQMCLNIKEVKAAQRAMLNPQEAVCKSADGTCPFFNTCHYQEQKQASADIWLVAHAALFHRRSKAIGQPAVLIVDEGIWQASLRGFEKTKTAVGFGSLQRQPRIMRQNVVGDPVLDVINAADLRETRHKLVTALRSLDAQKGQHLPVAALTSAGLTAEMCRRASGLEWQRQTNGNIRPGMDAESFKRRTDELAEAQGDIGRLATMWQLLAEAIDSGQDACGRVSYEIVKDGSGAEHEALVLRWSSGISQGWDAPTLHVDATLRPELVKHLFPRLAMAAEIEVAAPHQRTVAVVGKAFSHRALTEEKDVLKMWRAVSLRARLTPGDTLVVVPKRAEDIIKAQETVPAHIHLLHHNGTAGLDSFGQVRRLIVVGRTLPPPAEVARMTAAITGEVVSEIGTSDGWYRVELATVLARDGSTVTLPRERHLPGLPDAIRASVCEDQIIQAIGRGRGVNRTADTPLEVEIWGDCEPPVQVDAFHLFDAPSKDEQAMAAGLWVEAASDLSALHPALGSENAIKLARKRLGSFSNKDTYWNVTPTSPDPAEDEEMTALAQHFLRAGAHLRLAAYRKAGPGTRPGVAIWDARAYPDAKAALAAAIGELAVWQELRWPGAAAEAPETRQEAPQEPVEDVAVPTPPPPPPEPVRPPQPVSGVVITAALNVSQASHVASQGVVARRFRPPAHLMGSASQAIISAGFRQRTRPAPGLRM